MVVLVIEEVFIPGRIIAYEWAILPLEELKTTNDDPSLRSGQQRSLVHNYSSKNTFRPAIFLLHQTVLQRMKFYYILRDTKK